ncbi:MAG: hypothetical protein LCH37_04080 [Bacteroidetes bacterium]|nr:hypothetical protein [Bacteroidota bacterium]
MPSWTYRILPQQNLIITAFRDKIVISDIIQSNIAFSEDPLFNEDFDLLVDLSRCISIGFRVDILDYISFFRKRFRFKKRLRVCLIIGTLNQEYLARIYKTFGDSLNLDIDYFREMEDGLNWLNRDENQKAEIVQLLANVFIDSK